MALKRRRLWCLNKDLHRRPDPNTDLEGLFSIIVVNNMGPEFGKPSLPWKRFAGSAPCVLNAPVHTAACN